jgi:hypothetical protein
MTDTPKRYQCRHIFTDGHRCGSPCLRHEDFCYYHHTTRRPVQDPRQRQTRTVLFDLPMPEDRAAIQLSIGEVLRRIARNEIDPRRAGLLLYGLQIARSNLPRDPKPTRTSQDPYEPVPQPIEEITTDPEQGLLAPAAEFTQPERPRSVIGQLLDRFAQEKPTPNPEPQILPTLQATEENPTTPSGGGGKESPTFARLGALRMGHPKRWKRVRLHQVLARDGCCRFGLVGVLYGNSLDFKASVEEELRGADECARGIRRLEVLHVDAIEGREGGQVCAVDRYGDEIVHEHVRGLDGALKSIHHHAHLGLEVGGTFAGR